MKYRSKEEVSALWASVQEKISFDLALFHGRLETEDRRQQVLNCHLFLEHVLMEMLRDCLQRPSKLKLDRLTFAVKLDLAAALAQIPNDFEPPLRGLNKIRNKIAHNLDYSVTEQDIIDLENCSPQIVKDVIEGQVVDNHWLSRPTHFFKVIVILFDYIRLHNMQLRAKRTAAFNDLEKAIQKSSVELSMDAKD